MAKNLINMLGRGVKKVGKGLKKAVLVGTVAAAGLGAVTACEFPGPTPNRAPVITSTPTEQVNEGQFYNYDVDATDTNGDNLIYSLTSAPSWMSIDSNTGMISGTAPEVGSDEYHNIKVKVSDGKTFTPQDYTLTVKDVPGPDYVTIQGSLQYNKTGTNQPGEVRAYVDIDNDGIADYTLFDSDGYDFSFPVPSGADVKIKGMIQDEEDVQKSYVRTINLEDVISDQSGIKVTCVRYPDFNNDGTPDNINEFRKHMQEINFAGIPGLKKWDLEDGFSKIKIFRDNGSEGYFNDSQIAHIISRITDSNDIERFVRGSNLSDTDLDGFPDLDSYIEVVDHYTGGSEPNCIYVVPDGTPGGDGSKAGFTYNDIQGSIITYSRIELDPYCVNEENKAVSHEFGHAFVAPDGEAVTLGDNYTVMWTT